MREGQPTTYDVVRAVQRLPAVGVHLQRAAAAARLPARRLPLPGQDRLLPAVLRRDGADAAHARDPGARRGRLHAGLLRRRRRRSTAYATSTRTRGSRSGSPDIGWVPFDPTPSIAPADSQSSADAASAARRCRRCRGDAGLGGPVEPRRRRRARTTRGGRMTAVPSIRGWRSPLILLAGRGRARSRCARERSSAARRAAEDDRGPRRAEAGARRGPAAPLPPRLTLRAARAAARAHRGPGRGALRAAAPRTSLRRLAADRAPDGAARRDLRRALSRRPGAAGPARARSLALPPASFRRG